MSALRFCMLTTFYPPHNFGGDGIGIERLSRALARRGHEVTVVHDVDAYRLLSKGNEPAPVEQPDNLRVIGLRSRWPLLGETLTQQIGRPIAHGRRIAEILADGAFDVINFHNVSLLGGPGLLAYGEALKLYMAHEHWLVCPTHVLWRHMRERCTGRECLRCQVRYRRPPQLWRWTGLLERQARHVDAFIAMSEFSRRKHAEFGFAPEMQTLPYFLPDPDGSEAAVGASPHPRPFFLFVGRLERIKGLDDVIPAFARYPDADLVIAGEGTHGEVLRRLGASVPNVHFLGRVSEAKVRELYAHAIALLVPSECFETFGIIVIEAFRQRTPVIVRRVGPLPEIVEQAGGGLTFEGQDELLAALRHLHGDVGERDRLAGNGQAAFTERWSESAVLPRYLEIAAAAAAKKGDEGLARRLADAAN